MKVLLIDNGTSLLEKLQKLVSPIEITKKSDSINLADVNGHDLIILSGSSKSSVVYNHDEYKNEIELIRSTKTPVIGICFGCELIAYAFGGELKELKDRHQGIREIEICSNSFLENGKMIKVYENHRWIISKTPDKFEVIAKSIEGPEGIQHKTLPIYGLQFHPENFVDETEGDEIFRELITSLSDTRRELAIRQE